MIFLFMFPCFTIKKELGFVNLFTNAPFDVLVLHWLTPLWIFIMFLPTCMPLQKIWCFSNILVTETPAEEIAIPKDWIHAKLDSIKSNPCRRKKKIAMLKISRKILPRPGIEPGSLIQKSECPTNRPLRL